jgi:hypothetical protein
VASRLALSVCVGVRHTLPCQREGSVRGASKGAESSKEIAHRCRRWRIPEVGVWERQVGFWWVLLELAGRV